MRLSIEVLLHRTVKLDKVTGAHEPVDTVAESRSHLVELVLQFDFDFLNFSQLVIL